MSDDIFDTLMRGGGAGNAGAAQSAGLAAASGIVEFNEKIYLEAYPSLVDAITEEKISSGLDHYMRYGAVEGLLGDPGYIHRLAGGVLEHAAHHKMSVNIEAAIASTSGVVYVVGWVDDRDTALLSVSAVQGSQGWNTRALARWHRPDVDHVLQSSTGHSHGFWFVHKLATFNPQDGLLLRARFADGRFTQTEVQPRIVSEAELREIVLGHFATLQYAGNRDIEAIHELSQGAGEELVALNQSISKSITGAAHAEYYGPRRKRFKASFIVCLFGKVEYFFLQNALFVSGTGAEDIEFIYVSNSPELTDPLQKEARIAEKIYGLSLILVTLPGNAGFSAANNAAARFARSDRLVIINPDVFPQDDQWAVRHAGIIESRPRDQTTLFGAPLYYDDGSLMHGGMYFDIDRGLSVKSAGTKVSNIIRVEHYGKGAPPGSTRYTQPRPVPAVTGAFISVDRDWFESLGGFTEDYVYGHYEDADLCLKSLSAGIPAWIQDVRFWHLEGKGSVRRPPHEGGSLVNRWLFTKKWGDMIQNSLFGRAPTHPLLVPSSEAVAMTPQSEGASAPENDVEPKLFERSVGRKVRGRATGGEPPDPSPTGSLEHAS